MLSTARGISLRPAQVRKPSEPILTPRIGRIFAPKLMNNAQDRPVAAHDHQQLRIPGKRDLVKRRLDPSQKGGFCLQLKLDVFLRKFCDHPTHGCAGIHASRNGQ